MQPRLSGISDSRLPNHPQKTELLISQRPPMALLVHRLEQAKTHLSRTGSHLHWATKIACI